MSALARLLEQAPMTGPRIFTLEQQRDMARLLIDMADELRKHSSENEHDYVNHPKADALLARFAELEQRAAP